MGVVESTKIIMGWSIGYDNNWKRDIGYGVNSFCDHPRCSAVIDRGLAFVCGGQQPYGGDSGCGLYFCSEHQQYHSFRNGDKGFYCFRCCSHKSPYRPKQDHPEWINHKLTHKSWEQWRKENFKEVKNLKLLLK